MPLAQSPSPFSPGQLLLTMEAQPKCLPLWEATLWPLVVNHFLLWVLQPGPSFRLSCGPKVFKGLLPKPLKHKLMPQSSVPEEGH